MKKINLRKKYKVEMYNQWSRNKDVLETCYVWARNKIEARYKAEEELKAFRRYSESQRPVYALRIEEGWN